MKLYSMFRISVALTAVSVIGVATSLPALAEKLYSITDLGTLGGSYSEANGINNLGQVVGTSSRLSGYSHAFRTAPNSPINPSTDDLGVLNDSCISRARADDEGSSEAYGINDLGQVVGVTKFQYGNLSAIQAFRTAPNSPINPATDNLGTCVFYERYGGEANSINNLGQVVATVSNPVTQAFLTAPNRPINPATDNLGFLLSGQWNETRVNGINNFGQVVGSSNTSPVGVREHAFRTPPNSLIQALSNHSMIRLPKAWNFGLTYNAYMQRPINPSDDLGTLGGASSGANGINDNGQAVGSSQTASGDTHAFRTAPNSPINPSTDDLGTLGGRGSVANGINNFGQVVGNFGQVVGSSSFATTLSGDTHAFLYDEGQMFDLNNLIPTGSNFVLKTANAINDKGQIVGSGSINGQTHGFLLTPER